MNKYINNNTVQFKIEIKVQDNITLSYSSSEHDRDTPYFNLHTPEFTLKIHSNMELPYMLKRYDNDIKFGILSEFIRVMNENSFYNYTEKYRSMDIAHAIGIIKDELVNHALHLMKSSPSDPYKDSGLTEEELRVLKSTVI